MAKTKAEIVPFQGGGAVAVPDYIKTDDTRGKENITRDDITLPRLALAQALSPEIDKTDDKFIPGLAAGDLFNTLTREIAPEDGFLVVIVRVEGSRWVEFYPRDSKEGSGIKDPNVPIGDPRTEWGSNGEPPAATLFRDYIAISATTGEPIGLSFKGSSLRAGKDLNSLIKLAPGPTWGQVYRIKSAGRKNEHGAFYVFKVESAGFPSKEAYIAAERVFEQFAEANVTIERDSVEPTDDMASAPAPASGGKKTDEVPF
jgi:hypothetical protein